MNGTLGFKAFFQHPAIVESTELAFFLISISKIKLKLAGTKNRI